MAAGPLAYATAYPDWEETDWEGGQAEPQRQQISPWRVAVAGLGLTVTGSACAVLWGLLAPPTVVQMRFLADGAGAPGRAALAEAALRLGAPATLLGDGTSLVVTVSEQDPILARLRARSLGNAVLDLPAGTQPIGPGLAVVAAVPASPQTALTTERSRLLAEADAIDARLGSASASLSAVVRDIAAGARLAADRKTGHDSLDRAQSALAELQIQRIQLQSRYQDDFPAITVVDGQIKAMRSFIQDEQRRIDASAPPVSAADTALTVERDRLRTEMAQLDQRRVAVAADMAALPHSLANAAPVQPAAAQAVPAGPPAPVLIEGATTVTLGADIRWIALPAAAIAGLLLTLIAWFVPRRREALAVRTELLIERLEAKLLPGPIAPALPVGAYTALPHVRPDLGTAWRLGEARPAGGYSRS